MLRDILNYARQAPSPHNTQPWRFKINERESTISLFLAPHRALDAGDPTTRETWVSMGVCYETILQAAAGLGFAHKVIVLQTNDLDQEIVRIQFTRTKEKHPEILTLLNQRHTHRGRMLHTTVPIGLARSCQQRIKDLPGITVHITDSKTIIDRVADFTDKGIQIALTSAKFRKELAPLLHTNWSQAKTGLHGYVLNHGIIGSLWEKWSVILGVDSKRKARADRQKILEASALVFVAAKGDVPKFWFDTGRAYLRVALEITKAGLANSTLTAPIEAGRFHEDIERMLSTTDRIQSMMRIGKATRTSKRRSPRLDLEDLLT
jgi:hypothetical protein